MIAKELMTKHLMKQVKVAELLGVSQPAISLYTRKIRGRAMDLENEIEITKLIENLASSLAKEELSHKDYIVAFCEICRTIRAKGLMCKLHKTFDPTVNIEKCKLCSVMTIACINKP
jgi:predicted transcriptional regulator